jgi:lipoate-protein ligase B
MKIRYLKKADPARIDQFLRGEQKKRAAETNRNSLKDFVIAYEPQEAFSIQKETDLLSIRKKEEFWAYVERMRIPVIMTRRGGGIIWHGPGQVCLAPLVDFLRWRLDPPRYRNIFEETSIETLAHFGIRSFRNLYRKGAQGVWIENPRTGIKNKIAFFGSHNSRGISIHGCALNVSCDLTPFSFIDPCNLPDVEVSSMKEILRENTPTVDEVKKVLAETFVRLLLESKKT